MIIHNYELNYITFARNPNIILVVLILTCYDGQRIMTYLQIQAEAGQEKYFGL